MENEENGQDSSFPSWINAELLKEIISEELKKDISIINLNVKRALPKGENYLSVLYRVEAEYKDNKTNAIQKYFLVIKALPEGELMQLILSQMKGFQKELYMYTDIFPAMYRIIKSAKLPLNPLSARCLPCSKENIIVMEDLRHLGYKMALRKEGLDFEHCKITLRTLARFHAASIIVYKSDPSIKDMYEEGMYRDEEALKTHMTNNMNLLGSTVETWPGYEKYGEKLRKIGIISFEKMLEIVKPKKNSLNVLNHGDCWVNNMLFRYSPETGKIEDVRFVDFQIARFSSPALDLQYFMCNCPNDDVRFQYRDTLLEEYYSELADYCKALNVESELITLKQLKEEFEEKNFFGLITACTILCVILAEQDDIPDLKDLTEEDMNNDDAAFMKNAFKRKRYRDIFQKLLVFYERKGLL